MKKDYIQHLSEKMEKELLKPENAGLLKMIADDDLVFAVRKGKPMVYFSGGVFCWILTNKKGEIYLKIDPSYAKKEKRPGRKSKDEPLAPPVYIPEYLELLNSLNGEEENHKSWQKQKDGWLKNKEEIKKIMKNFYINVKRNEEGERRHQIAVNNNDFSEDVVVLDFEYGMVGETKDEAKKHGKINKVDIIALVRNGDKYDIAIIELKVGTDAFRGKAGIADHVKDFGEVLKPKAKDCIIKSVVNIVNIKTKFNLIKNAPAVFNEDILTKRVYPAILVYEYERDVQAVNRMIKDEIDAAVREMVNPPGELYYSTTNETNCKLSLELLTKNKA